MISPAKMKIIRIEVTNSCIHHCSNCTRFCGLHEKTFMMSMAQFEKAVDSLRDYAGIVGVMGGEPTLNPHFPEMIRCLYRKRPEGRRSEKLLAPVRDFNAFHRDNWNNLTGAKRGLWSALGHRYYENLEIISDIFPYQCLNDHKNAGMHQALLIPRRELGISDEEWYPLRDKCWIQNEWSASITPKGAFFCEIAAALDMLFDGPGGWPVEPGWWKRTPAEFGDQLNWCEMCSAALAVPQIAGNEETDIVSPGIWEKLKDRKAWKVLHDRCRVFDTAHYDKTRYSVNADEEPYLSGKDLRISQDTGNTLFPHTIAVLQKTGAAVPEGEKFTPITTAGASGLEFTDWLLILSGPLPEATAQYLCHAVFNPGVLYYAAGGRILFLNRRATALRQCTTLPLTFKELKGLFPENKHFHWINWETPDKPSLLQRWLKFKKRCRDCWNYRSGLVSTKIVMIGNILFHDWRVKPSRPWCDFGPFSRYGSLDEIPDISDLDQHSQSNIRRFLSLGMMHNVFDTRYYYFNYSKLLPPLPRKERMALMRKKDSFRKKYDLPLEMLDTPACCFSHGLSLLPDHVVKYVEHKNIIDAGAFIGDSALSFLPYKPEKIFSFEPSRQVFSMLQKNWARLAELRERCEIFQLALGDEKGDLHFHDDLLSCCHADENSTLLVKQTTIDDFLAGTDNSVGLIKADIEGMGLKMILGARKTILRDHPILAIAVYHCPEEMFGIRETLKSWGMKYTCRYEFLEPEPGGELTLIAYPEELDPPACGISSEKEKSK